MQTNLFDYVLPPERIAQAPMRPRDHSRLMVLNRTDGTISDRRFFDIGEFLRPGDLLVANDSKVFKARLNGTLKRSTGERPAEVFLLHPEADGTWAALAKPGKFLSIDSIIAFPDGSFCRILKKNDDGSVRIAIETSAENGFALAERIGEIPVPPYVERAPVALEDYQTVYAERTGSVAAPTAGFHFTPELIAKLKENGIRFATVTLHVGLGTFRPMRSETLEEHVMHEEWIDIPDATAEAIRQTKKNGGRVIAVGTTTVRALESGFRSGFTNIFITPGYRFKTVDAVITNFHLPKSTLLVLISAFAGERHVEDPDWGRRTVLAAYERAIASGYRFYSFGDAMLIA